MAHKYWETWMKFTCIPILLLSTTQADFTSECQRPCECKWQSGNKAATCTNSSLRHIPMNLSSEIQILDLSNNNLLQLHQEAFKRVGLSNLKKLFLRECYIEIVHKAAFTTLAIMIELDLSKNKIRHLHADTFKGTEKLRLINLSNNFIDKLEDGLFRNLKFLQKVEFSNNRLLRIGTQTFVNLPQLKILRFDGNNLSHMKPETLMTLENLSSLDLHNNPWRCDCNLQPFRDWVLSHNLYTPPTSCSVPSIIKGKRWNELNSSSFACRPTILEPQPDTTVKSYEENVTLVCKVIGNPTPEVTWRFNGKLIETTSFGEIRHAVMENTIDLIKWVNLTILFARYSDRGNYTCIAENPGGHDEQTLSLLLTRYGGVTIIGLDSDTFAIFIGSLTVVIILIGVALALVYLKTPSYVSKRLIKTDNRSSNGEVLIERSLTSEINKGAKNEVNPLTKPPRKYETPPSFATGTSVISDANKSLLDNVKVLDPEENDRLHPEIELTKELLERLSKDHLTYPPDLLSFPPKRSNLSSADEVKPNLSDNRSPIKTPSSGLTSSDIYRFTLNTSQGSIPLLSPKGYITLPRRPRGALFPECSQSQVFTTINGMIPYNENFNSKIFNYGGIYCSLNKSEIDLGIGRSGSSFQESSTELESAPSPAPGTPHSNIPRNSNSSPNIHNQLLTLQAIAIQERFSNLIERSQLDDTSRESSGSLRSSVCELRVNYSVNSGGTLSRTKAAPKSWRRSSDDSKDPYINGSETATQV